MILMMLDTLVVITTGTGDPSIEHRHVAFVQDLLRQHKVLWRQRQPALGS